MTDAYENTKIREICAICVIRDSDNLLGVIHKSEKLPNVNGNLH